MDILDKKRLQVLEALQRFLYQVTADGKPDLESQLLVGQVMTERPNQTPPDTTVLEMARIFHRHGYRHQLVTDEQGQLLGVISDRDVLRCFGPDKYPRGDVLRQITAREIMSTDLVTATPECSLCKGLDLMLEFGIGCLPVVSDGELVGILTQTDLQLVLQQLLQTLRVSRPAPSVLSPA